MPGYAYFQGKFMPLAEAKMGIMTHAFHYGTAAFEGIRGNWNADKEQLYLFRVPEHYQRLLQGCRLLKIKLPHTIDDLCRLTLQAAQGSEYREDVYIRPMAYKSSEVLGVKLHGLNDDFLIAVATLPPYLNTGGCRCRTSSWRRVDDTMIPARGKITGIYVNSALAKTEAVEDGYDEAIMLSHDGHVAEGTGENIFIVMGGKLVTPGSADNILIGITRHTVMTLARDELGIETVERSMDRSELYLADECFLSGTAAHITPVFEIDHRPVGSGKLGKVTAALQKLYFDVITGRNPKYLHWCTPVYPEKGRQAKAEVLKSRV